MENYNYDNQYNIYEFNKNFGYGTKKHIDIIKKNNISNLHRKSFLKKIKII